jgi:hypothetical protein
MLNAALRASVEHYAWRSDDEEAGPGTARADLAAAVRSALVVAAQGIS